MAKNFNSNTTNKISTKEKNKISYSPLINAKGSNRLATLPTAPNSIKARFVYNPENDEGLFSKEDLKVTISNFNEVSLLGKSILFLFYCLKEFTKTIPSKTINKGIDYTKFRASLFYKDSRTISIDFDEYLNAFGIENAENSKIEARRNLKEYFKTLQNITFEFTDYSFKFKKYLDYSLNLFSGKADEHSEIKRSGDIYFILNTDFVDYLTENNFITHLADETYKIDLKKYPNSLALITKLSVMYSLNYLKTNKGLVSVKNLLDDVLNIPSYEDVKKSQKSPYKMIIEPLERDLDYLLDFGLIESWEYCNESKEPLTDKQLENYSYKELIKCFIKYDLADYPTEIQEKRKQLLDKKRAESEKPKKTRKPRQHKAKDDSN